MAVITGASSGLGEEYAWQLADAGYDLLLVARRDSLLHKLQTQIELTYGIRSEPFACDLSDPAELLRLEERIAEIDNLEFLVNNAGFGCDSTFPTANVELLDAMLHIHCLATMRLCQAAMKIMCPRKKGCIINVSSIAALMFGTGAAQYGATKAYVLNFSRSLWCDARPHGVNVQALCPGLVHTGFHDSGTMKSFNMSKTPGFLWLNAKYVVRKSLAGIRRRKCRDVCIPSLRYKLIAALLQMPFTTPIIRAVYGKRARDCR